MVLVLLMLALMLAAVVAQARVMAASGEHRHLARPRLDSRLRRLPLCPAEDQPPHGLAPLLDSPRVVAREVCRGIRELELWLAEQATA